LRSSSIQEYHATSDKASRGSAARMSWQRRTHGLYLDGLNSFAFIREF
jgi:hypothetical protein